jgi:hypothetical protein
VFKKANTPEDISLFNHLLEKSWKEKGFWREAVIGNTDLYLFGSTPDQLVATLEMKPFDIGIYETMSNLSEKSLLSLHQALDSIQSNISTDSRVIELDYVSIAKEHRATGILGEILSVIANTALEKNADYIVAMVETTFFLSLKRHYKLPVERLSDPMILPKESSEVVAMLLRCDKTKPLLPSYPWYITPEDSRAL